MLSAGGIGIYWENPGVWALSLRAGRRSVCRRFDAYGSSKRRRRSVKIIDVTVTRYREPRQAQAGADIQVVDVHTDNGVTGRGFVSTATTVSDVVAMLL